MSGSSSAPCSEAEPEAAEGDELSQGAPALPPLGALEKKLHFLCRKLEAQQNCSLGGGTKLAAELWHGREAPRQSRGCRGMNALFIKPLSWLRSFCS